MDAYKRCTVSYTFELPEQELEEREARNGPKYHSVIAEFLNRLRNEYKYGSDKSMTASETKELLVEILQDEGVMEDF